MPPTLALILCILFVVFCLILEKNQVPDLSIGLWIPTIWILLTASKPLAVWFGSKGNNIESGSSLDQIVLIVLFFLGLALLLKRGFDWGHAVRHNQALVVLFTYMLLSVLWSDVPFTSFKRWIRELVALSMVFVVTSEHSPYRAFEAILIRSCYILIPFSALLIKYFPKYGIDYTRWEGSQMWIGVTSHKNSLAMMCLISSFTLIWTLTKTRDQINVQIAKQKTLIDIFLLIITLFLFKGPGNMYSATSFTALVIGLLLFFWLLSKRKNQTIISFPVLVFILFLIIATGTIVPLTGKLPIAGITRILGRNETLTGRTEIWEALVSYFYQCPIFGHAFGGFWTSTTVEEFGGVSESHNGYLEILLELGFVGLFLITTYYLTLARKFHTILTSNFYLGSLGICFLFMVLLSNITEATISSFTRQCTAILLILGFSYKRDQNS